MTSPTKIPIKQAVKKAFEFVADIYQGETIYNLMLEGVELSEDEESWDIVVSFARLNPVKDIPSIYSPQPLERVYKTIKIPVDGGDVVSMTSTEL